MNFVVAAFAEYPIPVRVGDRIEIGSVELVIALTTKDDVVAAESSNAIVASSAVDDVVAACPNER